MISRDDLRGKMMPILKSASGLLSPSQVQQKLSGHSRPGVQKVATELREMAKENLIDAVRLGGNHVKYRVGNDARAIATGPWRSHTNEQIGVPDTAGPREWPTHQEGED